MAKLIARKTIVFGVFALEDVLPQTASDFVDVRGKGWAGRDLFDFSSLDLHSPTLEALAALKENIVQRADEIEKDMCEKNGGWLLVKVGKKESTGGKSVQCSIPCLLENEEERRKEHDVERQEHNCTFWAPKSQLHQEGREHYCPGWLVKKGLERTSERSNRRFGARRLPVPSQVWPRGLKEAWIEAHLIQLPTEEEVAKLAQENERQRNKSKKEAERQAEEARLERERRDEEAKKEAARLQKRKEKRRAGMECRKNVTIVWNEWRKQSGKFVAEEYEAEGVDLYFSGERVYVVFEDGEEIIKKKSNILQVVEREER